MMTLRDGHAEPPTSPPEHVEREAHRACRSCRRCFLVTEYLVAGAWEWDCPNCLTINANN